MGTARRKNVCGRPNGALKKGFRLISTDVALPAPEAGQGRGARASSRETGPGDACPVREAHRDAGRSTGESPRGSSRAGSRAHARPHPRADASSAASPRPPGGVEGAPVLTGGRAFPMLRLRDPARGPRLLHLPDDVGRVNVGPRGPSAPVSF